MNIPMGIFGAEMNEIHFAGNGTGPISRKFGRQGNAHSVSEYMSLRLATSPTRLYGILIGMSLPCVKGGGKTAGFDGGIVPVLIHIKPIRLHGTSECPLGIQWSPALNSYII